jgi:hypothetical protein
MRNKTSKGDDETCPSSQHISGKTETRSHISFLLTPVFLLFIRQLTWNSGRIPLFVGEGDETGSPHVVQAGLKLLMLSSFGITGVNHHTWPQFLVLKYNELYNLKSHSTPS